MKKKLALCLAVILAFALVPLQFMGTVTAQAEEVVILEEPEDTTEFNTAWFGVNVLMYGAGMDQGWLPSGEEANDKLVFHWTLAVNGLPESEVTISRDEFISNYVDKTFVNHSDLIDYLSTAEESAFTYDAETDMITLYPVGGAGGFGLTLCTFSNEVVDGTGPIYCQWREGDGGEGVVIQNAVIYLENGAIERFMPVTQISGSTVRGKQGTTAHLQLPDADDYFDTIIDWTDYEVKWYRIDLLDDGYEKTDVTSEIGNYYDGSAYARVGKEHYAYYTCDFWKDGKPVPEIIMGGFDTIDGDAWYKVENTSYKEDQTLTEISHLNLSYDPLPVGSVLGDLQIIGESRYDVGIVLFGMDNEEFTPDRPYNGPHEDVTVVLRVVPKEGYTLTTDPKPTAVINDAAMSYYGDKSEYTFDPEADNYPEAYYFAFTGIQCEYDYEVLADNTISINKYNGKNAEVTVPSEIGGLPVSCIGEMAFANTGVSKVVLPDTVTKIGGIAFMQTPNLEEVTIPDSVTEIGSQAFYHSGIKKLVIPGSVKNLGYGFALLAENLEYLELQEGVENIGNEAFNSCYSLKTLKLPNTLKTIGGLAFNKCYGLTDLTIPGSVEGIGEMAFISCTGLKNVVIKDGVEILPAFMFSSAESLETISIPCSVTSIGYGVLQTCNNLTSIRFCGTKAEWNALLQGMSAETLPANAKVTFGHANKNAVTKATLTKDGKVVSTCTACGKRTSATVSHPATIKLASTSIAYAGKAVKPKVTVKDAKGKTIASTNYTVTYSGNTKVGTGKAKIVFKGNYSGAKTLSFKITKGTNPITVSGKTAAVYYSKLKKAAQTLAFTKVATVSKAQGTVTYVKVAGNSRIAVSKTTGKIKIAKGLEKGTYTVKVKVIAAGNTNYKKGAKTVAFKIKVK